MFAWPIIKFVCIYLATTKKWFVKMKVFHFVFGQLRIAISSSVWSETVSLHRASSKSCPQNIKCLCSFHRTPLQNVWTGPLTSTHSTFPSLINNADVNVCLNLLCILNFVNSKAVQLFKRYAFGFLRFLEQRV